MRLTLLRGFDEFWEINYEPYYPRVIEGGWTSGIINLQLNKWKKFNNSATRITIQWLPSVLHFLFPFFTSNKRKHCKWSFSLSQINHRHILESKIRSRYETLIGLNLYVWQYKGINCTSLTDVVKYGKSSPLVPLFCR